MVLACCTYQEQPTATPCCPAGRRRRWRWRSSPSISISGEGERERLQPAGQAGRPPLALTRGMLPFLLSCPPPSAVRPVCSMFVWKEAQAKQAMGKRSERGGGEEGKATDDCNRDCKSATATASIYMVLPSLGRSLQSANHPYYVLPNTRETN